MLLEVVPPKVKVLVELPVCAISPVPVKVSAPEPEPSMVPPLLVKVNKRVVLTAAPVYLIVPPSNIKLDAALEDAPILLLLPPLANEEILKVPFVIFVYPVYELADDTSKTPAEDPL